MRGCIVAVASLLVVASAAAQTPFPGDAHGDEPAGIVADPCPAHPARTDAAGWRLWNFHMLTRDHGQFCRYAAAHRALAGRAVRVVFMGDTITDNWINLDPGFWTDGRVDRGVSGQTTAQMLLRFRQDVIALRPRVVHIMAGTNDVAGATSATTFDTATGHISFMAELASSHGIRVVIASVPPAGAFPWSPGRRPAPQIAALNRRLKDYAAREGFGWADYQPVLATPDGAMRPGRASDGVYPNAAGYRAMRPVAIAIDRALAQ